MLKQIQLESGATIIHVTHDLTDAVKDGDHTLYIDQEIKFCGTYADYKLFEHEGHHHV
jgi:zinc transport system ATP-binding protein